MRPFIIWCNEIYKNKVYFSFESFNKDYKELLSSDDFDVDDCIVLTEQDLLDFLDGRVLGYVDHITVKLISLDTERNINDREILAVMLSNLQDYFTLSSFNLFTTMDELYNEYERFLVPFQVTRHYSRSEFEEVWKNTNDKFGIADFYDTDYFIKKLTEGQDSEMDVDTSKNNNKYE